MIEKRPKVIETPEPGLRRVLAPNPSAMTYWGTNTYIIGEGRVGIIDPGPDDPAHLSAILSTLDPDETVAAIFVTHSHLDHSALARPLSEATGAAVFAFGDSQSGRSEFMNAFSGVDQTHTRRGVHADFVPDEIFTDGEVYSVDGWSIAAIWTPGHFGNHLCFSWGDALFTGDHIMGWASTMVAPPDGDLTAFMTSLDTLSKRDDRIYYPGHGAAILSPFERTKWIRHHRNSRTAEIVAFLKRHPAKIPTLANSLYPDISTQMKPAAEATLLAHLIELTQKSIVSAQPYLSWDATFSLKYDRFAKLQK